MLFIDASRESTPGKKQNVMEEEHIAKVVETYRKREAVERYSHLATPDEIVENDYNLNIPRYVDTFEPEEENRHRRSPAGDRQDRGRAGGDAGVSAGAGGGGVR